MNLLRPLRPLASLLALATTTAALATTAPATPPPAVESPATAPASAADATLLRAVRERHLVTFSYHGHTRVVEPHLYGIAATGEAILHGYQTSIGGVSDKPPGWRTFTFADLRDLAIAGETFPAPRPGYTAERPRLDPVWAEISAPAQ